MLLLKLSWRLAIACSLIWPPAIAFAQQPRGGPSIPPAALLHQYLQLKEGLLSASGDRIWSEFRGKLNPLLRLTVVSADPPGRPVTLRLAPNRDDPAEVTLLLKQPLSFEIPAGTQVSFEGVAREFQKKPFHLTLGDAEIWLPPVVKLSADPTAIWPGGASTLAWTVADAYGAVLFPGGLELGLEGSRAVSPNQTTAYRIVARGPGAESEASAVVTVQPDSK